MQLISKMVVEPLRSEQNSPVAVSPPRRVGRPRVSLFVVGLLVRALSVRQLKSRYRDSSARGLWHILQPVVTLVLYGFVFTKVFRVRGGGLPYLSMAWAGLICYQYFQQAVQIGATSFLAEANSLTKMWYPRIAVPLAPATVALVELGIGLVLLAVAAAAQGIKLHVTLVALPVGLLLVIIWGYACALLLAPLTVFVRDLGAAIPLALRIGFFATPVMYPASAIPAGYHWLTVYNPIAVAIDTVRATALSGNWPNWGLVAAHLAAGLLILLLAVAYTRRVENRMVDLL